MTDYNNKPQNEAERFITEVFKGRENAADCTIARLRLENALKRTHAQRRPLVRISLKLAAFVVAMFVFSGWASIIEVPGWNDGQKITIELPDTFTTAQYPYWVAIFANHSKELADVGGHSLVVDYFMDEEGDYFLELSILGINYSDANSWIRNIRDTVPELQGKPFAIDQPMVTYMTSLKHMLAFRLGDLNGEQRRVISAWESAGHATTKNTFIYLIAHPDDYHKRASVVKHRMAH